jgi:hypothetical protein
VSISHERRNILNHESRSLSARMLAQRSSPHTRRYNWQDDRKNELLAFVLEPATNDFFGPADELEIRSHLRWFPER